MSPMKLFIILETQTQSTYGSTLKQRST